MTRSLRPASLLTLVLVLVALATIACRAAGPRLGEGPPQIDGNTRVLATFDPAAEAGPGNTGLSAGTAMSGPPAPPEPPPLPAPAVLDYGPTAEASAYPNIQIRFNRPMVPLGDKQRVPGSEAGFQFSPAIAGEAYWAEPTRLVFEPAEALPPAQRYEATFRNELSAVEGPSLDVDLAFVGRRRLEFQNGPLDDGSARGVGAAPDVVGANDGCRLGHGLPPPSR